MTKAVARFAAAYGTIVCPAGLSESQTVMGLMANIPHIRARHIIEMAAAFNAAQSPDGIPADLLRIAAESKEESLSTQTAAWRRSGMEKIASQFGA